MSKTKIDLNELGVIKVAKNILGLNEGNNVGCMYEISHPITDNKIIFIRKTNGQSINYERSHKIDFSRVQAGNIKIMDRLIEYVKSYISNSSNISLSYTPNDEEIHFYDRSLLAISEIIYNNESFEVARSDIFSFWDDIEKRFSQLSLAMLYLTLIEIKRMIPEEFKNRSFETDEMCKTKVDVSKLKSVKFARNVLKGKILYSDNEFGYRIFYPKDPNNKFFAIREMDDDLDDDDDTNYYNDKKILSDYRCTIIYYDKITDKRIEELGNFVSYLYKELIKSTKYGFDPDEWVGRYSKNAIKVLKLILEDGKPFIHCIDLMKFDETVSEYTTSMEYYGEASISAAYVIMNTLYNKFINGDLNNKSPEEEGYRNEKEDKNLQEDTYSIISNEDLFDIIDKSIEVLTYRSISRDPISDGYHTFGELYYHRMILFKILTDSYPNISWKSKLHQDGTMFEGMFIVGIDTPEGQYSYHYDLEHFDKFNIKELERAPEYDGHKPEDITRLLSLK